MRLVFLMSALGLFATAASAQQAVSPQQGTGAPLPPTIEERVDVVGVTPIHGSGLPSDKVPSNVQVFTADQLRSSLAIDAPSFLSVRAASVQVSHAQAGTFQPDVVFRGFVASPLLGASEGLAVYLDGVRMNDPFGDTIAWDILPMPAVASINVMPGSNPLFGLNALGGALSLQTKSGFTYPRRQLSYSAGAFGRHHLEAESGGHGDRFGYYVAGTLTHESGWRDFSPSTVRRLFGDLAWRGRLSSLNVSVTAASNDLTGNGTAPVDLLAAERDAVFTHPDKTGNDVTLMTVISDNTATDLLMRRLGIDAIAERMRRLGLAGIHVVHTIGEIFADMLPSADPDQDRAALAAWEAANGVRRDGFAYSLGPDNNVGTPRDMARLLEMIVTGVALDRQGCDAMLDILHAQQLRDGCHGSCHQAYAWHTRQARSAASATTVG